MAAEPNAVEQAVSRTLRDNLEKIQRNADELHQAINDLVSACASSRAGNALPSMLRAQTSAASLSATLEVLSRFVTAAMQPPVRMPFESDLFRVPSLNVPAAPSFEQPPPPPAHPIEEISWAAPAPAVPLPAIPEIPPVFEAPVEAAAFPEPAPVAEAPAAGEPAAVMEAVPEPEPAASEAVHIPVQGSAAEPEPELHLPVDAQFAPESATSVEPMHAAEEPAVEAGPDFSLDSLPPEEQELHRRAFRVAKVSMQDIRMLRPEDVRLGRENKDLCVRLRDDIEKAHKEYDRRFQAIQGHPVDYFYDWMVEILGGGDPQALGEYPYPSPVLRR